MDVCEYGAFAATDRQKRCRWVPCHSSCRIPKINWGKQEKKEKIKERAAETCVDARTCEARSLLLVAVTRMIEGTVSPSPLFATALIGSGPDSSGGGGGLAHLLLDATPLYSTSALFFFLLHLPPSLPCDGLVVVHLKTSPPTYPPIYLLTHLHEYKSV
jgi:hypothetical protein